MFSYGYLPELVETKIVEVPIKKGKNAGKMRKQKQPVYKLVEFGKEDLDEMLAQVEDEDVVLSAFNITMERSFWEFVGHKRLGWPSLEKYGIAKWEDTAAIAKANSMPNKLKDVAGELGIENQKDDAGHKAMMRISKPIAVSYANPYGRDLSPEKWTTVIEYCKQDVRTEEECASAMYPLESIGPNERRVWEIDQDMNHRGVRFDQEALKGAMRLIEESEDRLNDRARELSGDEELELSKRERVKDWIRGEGLAVDSLAKEFVEVLVKQDHGDDRINEMIMLYSEFNKTSVKKVYRADLMTRADGRARYTCQYYGASTGRWAGRGIQLQNLAKGSLLGDILDNYPKDVEPDYNAIAEDFCQAVMTGDYDYCNLMYGNPLELVSSSLRSLIQADPGKILLFTDYSSIEARVLAWIAGEKRMLEIFEAGLCVYKDMAGSVYKDKDPIADPQTMGKKDYRRHVGKAAILGLGYQMGAPKFHSELKKQGIDLDFEFVEGIVQTYRGVNMNIKNFWYNIERAAVAAVAEPGSVQSYRGVHFSKRTKLNQALLCKLPSGRMLVYPNAKLVDGRFDKKQVSYRGVDSLSGKKVFSWITTYGGKLTENIVQAVSRDIMAEALIRLEDEGPSTMDLLFTVHDEVVAQDDVDAADFKEMERLMCIRPEWAKTCPIAAEGDTGLRYRK